MSPADSNRSAIGLLKALLAASVVAPILAFVAASWVDYRSAFADAERDLRHGSEVAREQAAKVLDAQNQITDQISELIRGLGRDSIARSQESLHDAFVRIIAHLPQVQSAILVDRTGRALVSGSVYPVPDVSLADRDYFKAVMGGYRGTFVSKLQSGGVLGRPFFGLGRPWVDLGGKVVGVIDVAVLPSYFSDFYQILVREGAESADGSVMTLVRDDGLILVRTPPFEGPPPKAGPNSAFITAIRAKPDEGVYEASSIVEPDGPTRLFSYRKVQNYPIYVVAGRSVDSIVAGWRSKMASHLIFGIPVTLALLLVTRTALIRTRREEEALDVARQEIGRREAAEAALLRSQRLEAVGQMTGGVAHDFNNLLTVIMGSAELLEKRADDPARVRRIADQIAMAAKRGGEVTQQLLAFSRRQLVNPETINLNRSLRDFKDLLDRAAREAVRVELDLDAGLDPVRLDPGHFEAAVLNLVGNARDAMPDGGRIVITTRNIELRASDHPELAPGQYVRVAVSDTGVGMDPSTASKAFEPFFTTKEVGMGTGLGLSQVYGFAKQAGGDVRIATNPGSGTTVELLLPRAETRAAAKRAPADRAIAETAFMSERMGGEVVPLRQANFGEVVLIVEDEPAVLEMAVESLRDLGYATFTASTARAAMDRLRGDDRVDVLFSDVVMPGGMNGLQLAVEARRLRPNLKVLLTSGYSGSAGKEHPQDIPLLTKPYDRGQLAAQLRAVLRG